MNEQSWDERRAQRRIRLRLPVAYSVGGEERFTTSNNISSGGLFVDASSPLPLRTEVPLRVWLGSRYRDGVDAIQLSARVMHHGAGQGMGLQFKHR